MTHVILEFRAGGGLLPPQRRPLHQLVKPVAIEGFQTLWAQYDHVLPDAYGSTNDLDNLVVSCAA